MESKVQLCIRNFPDSFSESDISEFLNHFGIGGAKFLKRRNKITTVISVQNEMLARNIINRLHQLQILSKRLTIEYYSPREVEIVDVNPEKPPALKQKTQELSKFAKALHAVHPVDFSQPPPPYLKYRYPRPTREIIDSICVALESVPKFYTQVLHLMNRMNLPPPFTERDLHRKTCPVEKKDVYQQTDLTGMMDSLLAEGESELESDVETTMKVPPRHKLGLAKNRFKPYIVPQNFPVPKNKLERASMFERPEIKKTHSIKMHLPEELKLDQTFSSPTIVEPKTQIQPETHERSASPNKFSIITEQELLANRIPRDQLAELPVFKNYSAGTPSNKLYIKNLAKTVNEDDLRRIFHHFSLTDPQREIDIKLLQTGRMKGQAFVTFSYLYEEDLERLKEKPIERALRLTNGFILKDRPMVVMYGKTGSGKGESKVLA
ncbi:RNA-binding region-containing protein 3 [Topomyia yanbarensis]|uniref:RNA-binding region-containing protein 3 n=1 Tax=Topomyia yanbarensis TaxID=2498891 RepID=UPI00273B37C2|nr:RNA-binding region-containing protein 3 [Topomyia yanbarensis]